MKTNIVIYSDDLTKEDVQVLLQGIRDCEQKSFPEKGIGIFLLVPDLTKSEASEILAGITPPFKFGLMAICKR